MDSIDIWRYPEGEPKYEFRESTSTQIHPVTGEPIHCTIPLFVARLVYHDDEIMKIYDHQQEISLVRVEALEKEVKIWQDRAETSEQRVEDLQEALDRTKDGVHEHQDDKVTENASNKRKWEGDHDKGFSQQRNKGYKVIGAHVVEPSDKKGYARNLPWVLAHATTQRPLVVKPKTKATCYEYEMLGLYKSIFPKGKSRKCWEIYCKRLNTGSITVKSGSIS
ncbi:hypothetical protein Tco_1151216 [Tanacetum coccineum]